MADKIALWRHAHAIAACLAATRRPTVGFVHEWAAAVLIALDARTRHSGGDGL